MLYQCAKFCHFILLIVILNPTTVFSAEKSLKIEALRSSVNQYASCVLSFQKQKDCSTAPLDFFQSLNPQLKLEGHEDSPYPLLPSIDFIGLGANHTESCFPGFEKASRIGQKRIERLIMRQIREIAFFAIENIPLNNKKITEHQLGDGFTAFIPRRIEICSYSQAGASKYRPIKWKTATKSLIVYIDASLQPFKQLESKIQNSDVILKNWNSGVQFSHEDPAPIEKLKITMGFATHGPAKPLKILWPFIDPLGAFKSALFGEMIKFGKFAVLSIQNARKNLKSKENLTNSEDQNQTKDIPQTPVLGALKSVFQNSGLGNGVSELLAVFLANKYPEIHSNTVLEKVFVRWQELLDQKNIFETYSDELQSLITLCDISSTETKKLKGFVVVENNHTISVCVGDPSSRVRLSKELEIGEGFDLHLSRELLPNVSMQSTRDIEATGFVVVSTSDNVTVEGPLFKFLDSVFDERARSKLMERTFEQALLEVLAEEPSQ